MPYIQRDDSGRIRGILDHPEGPDAEELSLNDPEVMAFLLGEKQARGLPEGCDLHQPQCVEVLLGLQKHRDLLVQSDLAFIRVLEDLIDLLVTKGVLLFTELPAAAREKLLLRQKLRDEAHDGSLVVDREDVL